MQTRKVLPDDASRREAIRFATLDSTVALLFAFFINAAILILAAATFHQTGHQEVADIGDAYRLLTPLLGTTFASTLFAVALLASGQNSTITGTLAGQIVMEGFLDIRLPAWLRRLITRLIAIMPAVIVTAMYGERGAGSLLILSQVILSLQLSFAVVPLVYFTSQRTKMGVFANSRLLAGTAWSVAAVIVGLNAWLLVGTFREWAGLRRQSVSTEEYYAPNFTSRSAAGRRSRLGGPGRGRRRACTAPDRTPRVCAADPGLPSRHGHRRPARTRLVRPQRFPHPVRWRPGLPPPSGQMLREYEFVAEDREIEVAPGVFYAAWTYNGQVPGPTIRAPRAIGSGCASSTRAATAHSIHFHGGTRRHGRRFEPVHPGGSYVYEFDAEPFGLHLYHCHTVPFKRHIHKGLYGAFIIDPKDARRRPTKW